MNKIDDKEIVARFISKPWWISNGQVKGDAFRPKMAPKSKMLETSVVKHQGKDDTYIRNSGKKWESIPRPKGVNVKFIGWADIKAGAVRTASTIPALDVWPASSKKEPNHANIVGWSSTYAEQIIQAEEIARYSYFKSS